MVATHADQQGLCCCCPWFCNLPLPLFNKRFLRCSLLLTKTCKLFTALSFVYVVLKSLWCWVACVQWIMLSERGFRFHWIQSFKCLNVQHKHSFAYYFIHHWIFLQFISATNDHALFFKQKASSIIITMEELCVYWPNLLFILKDIRYKIYMYE